MSVPRRITAADVLLNRNDLLSSGAYWPHDYNASCGVWVACGCPPCNEYYDPTGEETAKYFNMDPSSFFVDQSDLLSFDFFKSIAKDSLFYAAKPGFYFDNDGRVRELDSFLEQLTPPIALQPTHILHIGKNGIDRFFLSADKTNWVRRTWKSGRSVYYKEGENEPIPFETSNAALRARLKELFT